MTLVYKPNWIIVLGSVFLYIFGGTYFVYWNNGWLGSDADLYKAIYHLIIIVTLIFALNWHRKKSNQLNQESEEMYRKETEQGYSSKKIEYLKTLQARAHDLQRAVTIVVLSVICSNAIFMVGKFVAYLNT